MDLEHLAIFANLAESLNYSQTAKNMHISQPAVSQTIKKMEQELGVQLLRRNRREVQLTANGEIFYQDVKSILNTYNKSVQRTRQAFTRGKSNLTIGMTETPFEEHYFPLLIKKFCEHHPDYKIFFEGHDHNRLKQLVKDQALDLVLLTHDDVDESLSYHHLASGPFVALAPVGHPFCQKELVALEDFTGQSLILMDSNWCPPEQFKLQEYIRKNVTGLDITYVNDVIAANMLVQAGVGITIMPNFVSQSACDLAQPVPLDYGAQLDYGLVCRKDNTNPAVADFVEFVSTK